METDKEDSLKDIKVPSTQTEPIESQMQHGDETRCEEEVIRVTRGGVK